MRTLVVAEAGSCHDGNLVNAFRLIETAKDAGADAVKFQTFNAKTLAVRRRAAEYFATYQRYEMPLAWLPVLKKHSDTVGIEFMTTVYHADYLPLVAPFVERFKIASFEAADLDFVKAHRPYGKPILCSVGMLSALDAMLLAPHVDTVLMCVSSYPTPMAQANLLAISSLREQLQLPIGLSDHTGLELTGALAVMLGAVTLEVHFALDTTDPNNPDMACALAPASLRHYVRNVRLAEAACGTGIKEPQECERRMAKYQVRP